MNGKSIIKSTFFSSPSGLFTRKSQNWRGACQAIRNKQKKHPEIFAEDARSLATQDQESPFTACRRAARGPWLQLQTWPGKLMPSSDCAKPIICWIPMIEKFRCGLREHSPSRIAEAEVFNEELRCTVSVFPHAALERW